VELVTVRGDEEREARMRADEQDDGAHESDSGEQKSGCREWDSEGRRQIRSSAV
jgi:hypothetical protein